VEHAGVAFHQPRTEAELQELLAAHSSPRIVAGGTDLMLEYTQNHAVIEALVDVCGIETLHGIERDGEALRIGAATPLRTLEHDLAETLPVLTELLTRYGSAQIRHRATLGGSLGTASPIGDLSPVLQVLGAELELVDARGERRRVSVDDFHLDYRRTRLAVAEYIAAAHLRLPSPDARLVVHKFSKRVEDDISTVLGAALVSASEFRIAWGGMAATPRRSPKLEQLLASDRTPDDSAIDAAVGADTTPMDDVRGSARYRVAMARAFVREVLDVSKEFGGA
jgi:xanthine dehydrogenase small subunit